MNLKLLDILRTKHGVTDMDFLGNGGFGVVYAGSVNEVPRAIKISRDVLDAQLLAMAELELDVMKRPAVLDCPSIVQLIGVWRELGHLITVWELCEQSLAKRLAECQRQGRNGLPTDELERHLREAAVGLDVINGLGVRHRDIKPDNILIVRGRAKIADLGLAVFVGASSLSKTASGTMGYIAPEAYGEVPTDVPSSDSESFATLPSLRPKDGGVPGRGRLTATVDIYALAATAIKLATNRDPFGTTPPVIIENQKAGRADVTGLTAAQAAAALSALHPNPKQRPFATAAEFVAAFFGTGSVPGRGQAPQTSELAEVSVVPNSGRTPPILKSAVPDPSLVPVANVFDFDIVGLFETSESEVTTAVAEARRLEAACRYGDAANVLEQIETHLRDNDWLRTLRDKQSRVDVLAPQIADAVRTKQHRWIRPIVDELIGLLPHDQKLKQFQDKLPEYAIGLTHTPGIQLKLIRQGEFLMGTLPGEVDRLVRDIKDFKAEYAKAELPQHRVRITQPFYCGVHPVTQGQWRAVMGDRNNPSNFKGNDQLPVENVSWFDAVDCCNALSAAAGLTSYYSLTNVERENSLIKSATVSITNGNGYRLPTEAEWEYCCRAGTTTIFPWGDDVGRIADHAWFDGNSDKKTHPVGQKRPNGWGLYDFTGQVWEWCQDVFDAELYGRRSGITVDPMQTNGSDYRVLRGGSWDNYSGCTRSAYRVRGAPDDRGNFYGFRVMLPFCAVRTS